MVFKKGDQCPVCKIGRLVERKGKYGLFLGCSKYPSCFFAYRPKAQKDDLEQQADDFLIKNGRGDLVI